MTISYQYRMRYRIDIGDDIVNDICYYVVDEVVVFNTEALYPFAVKYHQ